MPRSTTSPAMPERDYPPPAHSTKVCAVHKRIEPGSPTPTLAVRDRHELPLALLSCLFVMLLSCNTATAEALPQRSLALDGTIIGAGESIEFNWPKATASKVGRITIERRILGQTGTHTWKQIGSVRSFARIYRDEAFRPGVAYEYRVSRPGKELVETGYWATGLNLEANDTRRVALLVVDESLAADLGARLERFRLDLVGDGWKVIRHDVPRGSDADPVANLAAARKIRGWIQDRYNAAHYIPHALILFGRIPVVRSGESRPDGHRARPLETDLFYADTNAVWLDDGQGVLLHNSVPSDHIEMQVGRIDFSGLDDAFGDEVSLLQRYLDKNHHWRHGRLGDLRQAYGGSDHLFVEQNALRNIVGPQAFVAGGHHDTGTRQAWLLGVDFGSADYSKYVSSEPIKSVFTINFGSGKLDFSRYNNEMKAVLAQPWYSLTTGWGGRPAWQLHHMALGKSIGYSHLRTVNNGRISTGGPETLEYSPTGNYPWLNPVWVNLLGDPTLRPFPVAPVANLRAKSTAAGVQLDWVETDPPTGTRYRIYRAADRYGPYRALNPTQLHNGNRFVDSEPTPGAWYMVRAQALKEVHAGSFHALSQGAFATVANLPPSAADQSISTPMGEVATVRFSATDPNAGDRLLAAPIRDGAGGRLTLSKQGWTFVPDAGFEGRVQVPFSVFDGIAVDDGLLSIDVVKP